MEVVYMFSGMQEIVEREQLREKEERQKLQAQEKLQHSVEHQADAQDKKKEKSINQQATRLRGTGWISKQVINWFASNNDAGDAGQDLLDIVSAQREATEEIPEQYHTVDECDIELVMKQCPHLTRDQAIKALQETNGNVGEAILSRWQ